MENCFNLRDIEDISQILYWYYKSLKDKNTEHKDMDTNRILELKRKLSEIKLNVNVGHEESKS